MPRPRELSGGASRPRGAGAPGNPAGLTFDLAAVPASAASAPNARAAAGSGGRNRCAACASGKGACATCEKDEGAARGRCPSDGPCDGDPLARHQGHGTTVCDRTAGVMQITQLTEHCGGNCVRQHEEVHRHDDAECCHRVQLCLNAAGGNAARRAACNTAYDNWFTASANHAECPAYRQEVVCLTDLIARRCGAGAGSGPSGGQIAGGIVGGVLGGVLGAVGGFFLGGPIGAVLGGVGGAALGATLGTLIGGAGDGPIGADCCNRLRRELAFATSQQNTMCTAAAVPCPFHADGTV
jgi:hypothetical protein